MEWRFKKGAVEADARKGKEESVAEDELVSGADGQPGWCGNGRANDEEAVRRPQRQRLGQIAARAVPVPQQVCLVRRRGAMVEEPSPRTRARQREGKREREGQSAIDMTDMTKS